VKYKFGTKRLLKKVVLSLLFSSSLALFLLPLTANAQTATFTAINGTMTAARYYATATLLPDGKVLIAGGDNNPSESGALASAELYDPALGTFTATTGPMTAARYLHTATLLPNGKVLLAGGLDNNISPLASAELYDPALGTFTATSGPMTAVRYAQTATLLPNGKVLLVGGINTSRPLAGADLYDPALGTFTATTGPLATARGYHAATLLPNGTVLVAGGYFPVLASAELYDPVSGSFAPTTGPLAAARYGPTATLLPDGDALVAGGFNNSNTLASAELYDPALGTFSATTDPMTAARLGHTATLLPNGKVLVTGGVLDTGGFINGYLASAELYDPASGTFTATSGPMTAARGYHTATLLPNGQVLVAGGFNSSGALASAELFGVGPPTDKDQCKGGGWRAFTIPEKFKNQGDCIQFVNTGK
jgi:hypothetical protein